MRMLYLIQGVGVSKMRHIKHTPVLLVVPHHTLVVLPSQYTLLTTHYSLLITP